MLCVNCGINPVPPDHQKCCSWKCFTEWSRKNRQIERICKNCGKPFSFRKSFLKKQNVFFCSMKCRSEYGRVEIVCEQCGKKFSTFKSYARDNRRYCSKRCMAEHRRILYLGELNPNYRNGLRYIGTRMRGLIAYKRWKLMVFQRDKFTCQMCKNKFPRKLLEPHHKIRLWKLLEDYSGDKNNPNWLNDPYFYDVDNGVTLCKRCHRKTYGKDDDKGIIE